MKNLITVLLFLSPLFSQSSFASGCGGPEYFLRETLVVSENAFATSVESHNVYLQTNLSGPVELKITAYSKLLHVQDYPYFFWHNLLLVGPIPKDVKISEIEALLQDPTLKIELVNDSYDINCGDPDSGTESNLRLVLKYHGQDLQFRTPYVPASKNAGF